MTNIEIIELTIEDIEPLQKIGRQTFLETFAASNSLENMSKYLESGFSTEKLLAELANTNTTFYIVKSENEVVGYLKLNFGDAQTELKDSKALEIERIYVAKAFQGKNIGQLLYEKAIQVATDKKVEYVWLGVWEENEKAINFYKKNGFEAFDKHIFKLGDDEQTDIMMKLEIK